MATQKKAGGQRGGSSKTSSSAKKSSGTRSSRPATKSSSSGRSTTTRRTSSARTGGAKSSPGSRKARDGKGVIGSRAFERAKKAAKKVVADPAEARKLDQRASKKASEHKDALGGVFGDLHTLLRLIRAYSKKEYRGVPKRTLVSAAGAVIYFVSPADLIPDVIPGIGYVDDVAVLLFVVDAISNDLDAFGVWERERDAAKKRRARPAGAKAAGAARSTAKSGTTSRSRPATKGSASQSTAKARSPKKGAPRTHKKPAKN